MRRLALISLLCTLAACGRDLGLQDQPPPNDPARTTVGGRARVERPGEALPVAAVGTVVDVRLPDGSVRATTVAGEEGRFALVSGAPPFTLHLQYDSTGDGVADRMLLIPSSELPILDGTDFSLGDVLLGRSVEVHGTVRRGDLPGLDVGHDGIQIEALALPIAPVTTNSRGEFVLRGLPAGAIELRLTAAGYRVDRVAVDSFPGQSVRLSDVTLTPLEETPAGGIVGRVVRSDGLAGDAIVELISEADSRSVARVLTPLGSPFGPIDLPPGRYTVRAETGGFPSVPGDAFDLASGQQVDVGTISIRVGDDVLVRDGAIASWEPSSQQLLPALGPITASFASRLEPAVLPARPGTLSAFPVLQLVDGSGSVIEGSQYLEELEEPALPGGLRTLVSFYPTRPLAPGRYVASVLPTVVDADGAIPPAAPTSWISLGVGVTPGPEAAETTSIFDQQGQLWYLPLELQDFPDGRARLYFASDDPFGTGAVVWHRCVIDGDTSVFCDDGAGLPPSIYGRWATPTEPEAALFRDLTGVTDFCVGAPVGRNVAPISGAVLFGQGSGLLEPRDAAGQPYCASAFAPSSASATEFLATIVPPGRFPVPALHALSLSVDAFGAADALVLDPTPLLTLPFVPTSLEVATIGGARWVALHDAADGELPGPSLLLAPSPLGGALAALPPLEIAQPDAIHGSTSLCAVGDRALAIVPFASYDPATQTYPYRAQLQSFLFDASTRTFEEAAPWLFSPAAIWPSASACVTVGGLAFVTAIVDERLFAFWFDGVRWEPILDRTTPDGALTRSGCSSTHVTMLPREDEALVAHTQVCPDGTSVQLELLR